MLFRVVSFCATVIGYINVEGRGKSTEIQMQDSSGTYSHLPHTDDSTIVTAGPI